MLSISSVQLSLYSAIFMPSQFDHFLHQHGISLRKIVLRSVWLALIREEKKTETSESPSSTVPLCLRITSLSFRFTLHLFGLV
ncbi:uncharacterized protein LOC111476529 isoform X2 [Cucurbita maxima]|uniref:Uncharacterized protein LOC111476529 isoform X2 n=1 Tax=Cucurbita maxima TaxID=3661 RepID=A0A6J1IM83_CUCMA|nr:uncharacterized protein LOC111476529 isoform X2 [Cucurbita maxima]